MTRNGRFLGLLVAFSVMAGVASAEGLGYRIRKRLCEIGDTCPVEDSSLKPSGYSGSINITPVTGANQSLVSFTISGAQVGDLFNWVIDDTNPGTAAISGNGTITSTPFNVTGINVSSLSDGVLTLRIQVSHNGVWGNPVSVTFIKNTAGGVFVSFDGGFDDLSGTATSAGQTLTSNEITVTGFAGSIPVSVSGDPSARVSINGAPCTAASGTIQSGQTLSLCANSPAMDTSKTITVTVGASSANWKIATSSTSGTGDLMCWGDNTYGQLGDGTTLNSGTPVAVNNLGGNVTAIEAGGAHTCVLQDGALKCWGWNYDGQLGNGTTSGSDPNPIPVAVSGMESGVTAFSSGDRHTCAIQGGALKCWGGNAVGELGDGTTVFKPAPVAVIDMDSNVTAVVAGGYDPGARHTCAIQNEALKCWGSGYGTTPVAVSGMESGVTAAAIGNGHTCAIQNAALYCWGANNYGQYGDGTRTTSATPVAVPGMDSGVTAIVAGFGHTCALQNAAVKCWGFNRDGEVGDGSSGADRLTPVAVTGMESGVTAITASGDHTCALQGGALYCWGWNTVGQLGTGIYGTDNYLPGAVVGMGSGVTQPSAGNAHVCAISGSGTPTDTSGPTISTLFPQPGSTDIAEDADLVLTFGEDVVAGAGNIVIKKLSDGTVVETIPVSDARVSISGKVVTINPAALFFSNTPCYVEIAGGAFEDASGNAFAGITGSGTWAFTPEVTDFAPPLAASFSPANGAAGAAVAGTFGITFDEPVVKGSGNIVIRKTADNSAFETIPVSDVRVSVAGSTATIDPAGTLAGLVGYYVEVAAGAFKDVSGNGFAGISGSGTWAFTSADLGAPTIVGLSPINGAASVTGTSDLVLTFSENVVAGTGSILIKKSSDNSVAESIPATDAKVVISDATVTINPATVLSSGTGYYVVIPSGVFKDASGNAFAGLSGLSGPGAWSFSVGEPGDPICTGSQAIGTKCGDGTVYSGVSPDGGMAVFATRCDGGMTWSGSDCVGSRSMMHWAGGYSYAGMTNTGTGKLNTALLAGRTDEVAPYVAAKYCHDLIEGGYDDWYLPSKDELQTLYANRTAIGGFYTGNDVYSSGYWSSSEDTGRKPYAHYFYNNSVGGVGFNANNNVRCIRSGASLVLATQQGNPAAMNISGGSSPGAEVVFTVTNTGSQATGALSVVLQGDMTGGGGYEAGVSGTYPGAMASYTGNFGKTADTCSGQVLAPSDSCSVTVQPVAWSNGSYKGDLLVSGGGTVSRTMSGAASGFVTPTLNSMAADGTVYAGLSPDGHALMYAMPCDPGMTWNGSACTGTRSLITWGFVGTETKVNNTVTGEANTAALVALGGSSDTYAAGYCSTLVAGGHDDWYLPAMEELVLMLSSAQGAFKTSFSESESIRHWASTEAPEFPDNRAWSLYNSFGMRYYYYLNYLGKSGTVPVRCVRKGTGMATDPAVPTVSTLSPADDATGVKKDANLVITFSKNMQRGTGNIVIRKSSDNSAVETIAATDAKISVSGAVVTINPATLLAFSTGYYVEVAAGAFRDTAGNSFAGISGGSAWSFATEASGGCTASPPSTPGTLAAGGLVYVGCSPDGDVPMYAARCDAGQVWDGSSCSGTRSSLLYGAYNTVLGLDSTISGEANTAALQSVGDASAAQYCHNLSAHSKNDWYLPAKDELDVVYDASISAGGAFRASFDTQASAHPYYYFYRSSTEAGATNTWMQAFYDGMQFYYINLNTKTYWGGSVRCVRKGLVGTDTTAPTVSGLSPADGATTVSATGNLVLNFNEDVVKGTGNIVIKKLSDGSVFETIPATDARVSFLAGAITINPSGVLVSDVDYYVNIDAGAIKDMMGNPYAGMSGTTAWNFKIGCSGAPGAPGMVMPDGTVYIGCSPDGDLPMYVTRCDGGQTWDGSACVGTRASLWFGANDVDLGLNSTLTGAAHTNTLATRGDATATGPLYCYNLAIHSKGDWYLPAKSELNVVYNASVAVGGTLRAGFDTRQSGHPYYYFYRSSTEAGTTNAWFQQFYDGVQGYYINLWTKTNWGGTVRCTRKGTGTDISTPDLTLNSVSPADGATGVSATANLSMTFNKNMMRGTSGNIVIKKLLDDSVVETIPVTDTARVTFSGATVTVNPTAILVGGVYVNIDPWALIDTSYTGYAGMTGKTAWNFDTLCEATPAIGCFAADGTVYAGVSPDVSEASRNMYVQRCDAGQTWSGSACTGTRQALSWNNGTANAATGITNANTGKANSAALAALTDAESPHQAAQYCESLVANGRSDWYLPAKAEMKTVLTNRGVIGGFDYSGVISGYYSSSTEFASVPIHAWYLYTTTPGGSAAGEVYDYKSLGTKVRCVRK